MSSIISDPNLKDLINEYNVPNDEKLKEILSKYDVYKLRNILFDSNPNVLGDCDVCKTTDMSKYCSNCKIAICAGRHNNSGITQCMICDDYFCTDCLQLTPVPPDLHQYQCYNCSNI